MPNNPKEIIAYKALSSDLKSYQALGHAEVTYSTEEYVSAPQWLGEKGYDLLIFDTLKNLNNFWVTTPSFNQVWEVSCRGNVREPDRVRLNIAPLALDKRFVEAIFGWPAGSLMAEEVKLLRRIS